MTIDIRKYLEGNGASPFQPDSEFQGKYHSLQLDCRRFETDYSSIMEGLAELAPAIGRDNALLLMEQTLWRVLEGRAAVRAFLQAVFGEQSLLNNSTE